MVSAKHHYISRFHLKSFCDASSTGFPDPWLWLGDIESGMVSRKSPKNFAHERLMFDGPGGLADRESTIESHLANEIEGPAARALRDLLNSSEKYPEHLPPALMRYLAWAAARSLSTRQLEQGWFADIAQAESIDMVEDPPEFLRETRDPSRLIKMVHAVLGKRVFESSMVGESEINDGWMPDLSDRDNFLECVHIQACYFQSRWFPRLAWSILQPPSGRTFVLSDRAVFWGAGESIQAPPNCLRSPDAYIWAVLSPHVGLLARYPKQDAKGTEVDLLNRRSAEHSTSFLVASTADAAEFALQLRVRPN